jgi:hypothetical protein
MNMIKFVLGLSIGTVSLGIVSYWLYLYFLQYSHQYLTLVRWAKTQIKIYVVRTETDKDISLNALVHDCKLRVLNEYGGLTVIPNCLGLWVDDSTVQTTGFKDICIDNVEIWEIWTEHLDKEQLRNIALEIKTCTKQKSQLYTVNFKSYFV